MMTKICKKYGYYVGAALGSLVSAWSIFKLVTSGNSCECCEEPEENAEDSTDEASE